MRENGLFTLQGLSLMDTQKKHEEKKWLTTRTSIVNKDFENVSCLSSVGTNIRQ